jgi:hypothetical protein
MFQTYSRYGQNSAESRYYKAATSVRNPSERGFGVLKKQFRCLKVACLFRSKERVENMVFACFVIHNQLLVHAASDIRWEHDPIHAGKRGSRYRVVGAPFNKGDSSNDEEGSGSVCNSSDDNGDSGDDLGDGWEGAIPAESNDSDSPTSSCDTAAGNVGLEGSDIGDEHEGGAADGAGVARRRRCRRRRRRAAVDPSSLGPVSGWRIHDDEAALGAKRAQEVRRDALVKEFNRRWRLRQTKYPGPLHRPNLPPD